MAIGGNTPSSPSALGRLIVLVLPYIHRITLGLTVLFYTGCSFKMSRGLSELGYNRIEKNDLFWSTVSRFNGLL